MCNHRPAPLIFEVSGPCAFGPAPHHLFKDVEGELANIERRHPHLASQPCAFGASDGAEQMNFVLLGGWTNTDRATNLKMLTLVVKFVTGQAQPENIESFA